MKAKSKNTQKTPMKKILFLIILSTLTLFSESAFSQMMLFDENMDNNPPYVVDTNLPTGGGKINYGRWSNGSLGTSTVTVVAGGIALSSPNALALTTDSTGGSSHRAQAAAYFGTSNTVVTTTTEALEVKFAFKLPSATDNQIFAYIGSGVDQTVARVDIGGSTGTVVAYFAGGVTLSLGSIEDDTWYYLTFNLPKDATSSSLWTATLSDAGMNTIGSQTGQFVGGLAEYSYKYMVINNYVASTVAYIDNVSVEIVPEPNSLTMLLIGMGACAALMAYRKRAAAAGMEKKS